MADINTVVTNHRQSCRIGRFTGVLCPWNRERMTTIPLSAFTGHHYNGINVTLLWEQAVGWSIARIGG